MPSDTNRMLTEIANLTKNMDVLLKEMKESNNIGKVSSEAVSSLTKNIEGGKNGNLEKMFGDLIKSMDGQTKETKGMYDILNSTLGNKEVSNLLSNKNLANVLSGKGASDLDLNSILGDKPGDALGNIVGDKIGDKIGSKLESTLEGKVPDVIASVISNALGSVASNFAKGIPSMIANVKAGEKLDFGSIIGGGKTEGLVTGIASQVPGLKKGGIFKKGGLSVVGEDGPELLVGNAGEQIVSNENLKYLKGVATDLAGGLGESYPMGADGLSAKDMTKWMSLLGGTGQFKGEEGFGQISDFIKYAYDELGQDDIQEILSDPASLKDEISYFLGEQGRETFTQTDVAKLTQPVSENANTGSVEKMLQDKSDKSDKSDSDSTEKKSLKSRTEKIISKVPLDSIKDAGGSFIDKIKSNELVSSGISSFGDKLKGKLKGDSVDPGTKIGSMVNNATNLAQKASSIAPNLDVNAIKEKATEGISKLKGMAGDKSTGSPQESANPQGKSKPTESKSASPQPNMQSQDLGDLKGILTAIYQALRSPLTIANDVPFRPHSNNF